MASKTRDQSIDILKGMAMIGVVLLHVISSLDASTFTTSPFRKSAIAITVLLRFSVPLFVGLSGYLLAKNYIHKPIDLAAFLKKRMISVIPLYLLWSFIIVLALQSHPNWYVTELTLTALITGTIDYHLYFVPMLVCLYLVFPLIHVINKKWLGIPLVVSFLSQLYWFIWISRTVEKPGLITFSDHAQYVNLLSWIFYFCLGYSFSRINWLNRLPLKWLAILTLATFYGAYHRAESLQLSGIDIIITNRFTTTSVMVYASVVVLLALTIMPKLSTINHWIISAFGNIGKHSFLIFLSHTLILRAVFPLEFTNDFINRIQVFGIAMVGLVVSRLLQTKVLKT